MFVCGKNSSENPQAEAQTLDPQNMTRPHKPPLNNPLAPNQNIIPLPARYPQCAAPTYTSITVTTIIMPTPAKKAKSSPII